MANVERGVVRPPNIEGPAGARVNSCGPMGKGHGDVKAPNNENKTARVNSCGPMQRTASDCTPPNQTHKFKVEDAHKGYTDADTVDAPGKGSVPVNPFSSSAAGIVPAHILRDSAKR